MKNPLWTAILCLSLGACSPPQSPKDSSGIGADQFALNTFRAMVENRYAEVADRFNEPYRKDFIEKNDGSIEAHFEQHIGTWQVGWLKAELLGNDYNTDIWRVKVIPDEGKGAQNGPGMVMDTMLIDGRWKFVLWSNHPKS